MSAQNLRVIPKSGVVYKYKVAENVYNFFMVDFLEHLFEIQIFAVHIIMGFDNIKTESKSFQLFVGENVYRSSIHQSSVRGFDSAAFEYATLEETKRFVEKHEIQSIHLYKYEKVKDLEGYYRTTKDEEFFDKVSNVCSNEDDWYSKVFYTFIIQQENMGV